MPGLRVSTSAAVPCDGDRLCELSELQRDVQRRVRVDLQHDAGLHELAESLQLGLEPVRTDRQVLQRCRSPASSVTAVRVSPVSVCVTVIVTPGKPGTL